MVWLLILGFIIDWRWLGSLSLPARSKVPLLLIRIAIENSRVRGSQRLRILDHPNDKRAAQAIIRIPKNREPLPRLLRPQGSLDKQETHPRNHRVTQIVSENKQLILRREGGSRQVAGKLPRKDIHIAKRTRSREVYRWVSWKNNRGRSSYDTAYRSICCQEWEKFLVGAEWEGEE